MIFKIIQNSNSQNNKQLYKTLWEDVQRNEDQENVRKDKLKQGALKRDKRQETIKKEGEKQKAIRKEVELQETERKKNERQEAM